MTEFSVLLQQTSAWVFIPSALLLGALHGLEPGHSKTMIAAFIIAIQGTLAQSVLLGISATISHTAVVWIVAMTGLYFGHGWNTETTEPYLQLSSALLIIGIAGWMLRHTWIHQHHALNHKHHHAPNASTTVFQDPHELAHANDIHLRFAGQSVTNGQIVLFGLTGGLIPCPASITVLLLCLQLKQIALGATLVLCFSLGLAMTMISAGALAALSLKHLRKSWIGFDQFTLLAPYLSSSLIILMGVYMGVQGLHALH